MSKERARRRAEREAARAAAEAVRLRRFRRRAVLHDWLRRLRRLRPAARRSAWGLGRRSPAQRSMIVGVGLALLFAVWYFVDSLATRIALSLLVLLVLPVLAIVSFDRKGFRL